MDSRSVRGRARRSGRAVLTGELAASAGDISYERGEVIVRIGERCDPSIVREGVLRYAMRSEDGRSATLRYVTAGEAFGFESLYNPMPFMVVAMTPCRVTQYDRQLTDDLSRRNASLARWIAEQVSELVLDLGEAASACAFSSVAERVVHQLALIDSINADREPESALRLSHQQLADAVGSVREVVSRVIRDLKDQRMVSG